MGLVQVNNRVLCFIKKRAFVLLVFSFLVLRLGILLTSVEYTSPSWLDEAYRGTIAKELIEGLKVPLWDYQSEGWAMKFFFNWKESLKWQRLKPFEKFARMIEKHWDGIAAYCQPENKVPLGFVEGLNNKIRVIQRRAYGLRDEEYLRLKILTCMLKEI